MKELGNPELFYIQWDVTGACNLHCKHCRATSAPDKRELTTGEGKKLIKDIADFKPIWFGIDGGEPLLRQDVYELINFASKKKLKCLLLTNGTLISRSVAEMLKESGIWSCQISIDGLKKTHDYLRGVKGTFDKAVNAIKNLQASGIRTTMRMTVSNANINEAIDVLNLAVKLKVDAFGIRRIVPVGRAVKNHLDLDPLTYKKVIEKCLTYRNVIDVKIGVDPILVMLDKDLMGKIKKKDPTFQKTISGCAAGMGLCHVNNIGEVYPCSLLPISAGNIRKTPFKEIWKNGEIFQTLRERENIKGKCGDCKYLYICGGCRASAMGYNGDFLGEDPFCFW